MRLKGRYIPDSKPVQVPARIIEIDHGDGMTELHPIEVDAFCFAPRQVHHHHKKPLIQKIAVVASVFAAPLLFVLFADILVMWPYAFFGAFAAAVGWPALVFWANYKD